MKPSVIVAVAFLAVVAYVTLNTIATEGTGARGLSAGTRLPPFAAPLATSRLEGDANVATRGGQGQAGSRPACEVRGPDVVNSCELAERGPVVLAFLAEPVQDCREQVDMIDRLARRFDDVGFAVVAAKGDRQALRDRIAREGWRVPVAHDPDAAVWNSYAVGACPMVTLAGSDGRIVESLVGRRDERELAERIERLR